MGKKTLCTAAALIICMSGLSARELAFHVVQHNGSLETVSEQTLMIEDIVLDYFFNRGDIVTNEPAEAVKADGDAASYKKAFSDAADGGAAYFIQLRLYYVAETSSDPASIALSNIDHVTWTVTEVQSGKKIADMKGRPGKAAEGQDETEGVKSYAADIADAIQKVLNEKA